MWFQKHNQPRHVRAATLVLGEHDVQRDNLCPYRGRRKINAHMVQLQKSVCCSLLLLGNQLTWSLVARYLYSKNAFKDILSFLTSQSKVRLWAYLSFKTHDWGKCQSFSEAVDCSPFSFFSWPIDSFRPLPSVFPFRSHRNQEQDIAKKKN